MIFIFEGPDGAGKSTAANKLSAASQIPVTHFSYPKDDSDMFKMYSDVIYSAGDIIIDRCWYSEMIYGTTVRDKSLISLDQMYELERLVLSQGGGIIIHCTAPMGKLWSRFRARGDDYIKEDFDLLDTIRRKYEKLIHSTPHVLPVVRYELNEKMQRM